MQSNKDNKFNCSKCGECCRHIDLAPQLAAFDDGMGVCIYLKNNLCSIYDTRPDICNVDAMYEKEYKSQYTKEEFYLINERICEKLKKLI